MSKSLYSSIAVLFLFCANAAGGLPYVVFSGPHAYPNGDYCTILPESGEIVSRGNFISDILRAAVPKPGYSFSEESEIGDFSIDIVNDRLFMFVGDSEYKYSGILVFCLSTREFLTFIPREMIWGHKNIAISGYGKIYLTDWDSQGNDLKTSVYDATTFAPLAGAPARFKLSDVYCFIPGEEQVYADRGIHEVSNPESFSFLPELSKYLNLACANGKLLRYENGSMQAGGYKLNVWDLKTSTVTQTISPSISTGVPSTQWVLSPSGEFAVFGDGVRSIGYRSAALLSGKLISIFDTGTGKQTASVTIRKTLGVDESADVFFMGFSLDGRKLLIYSDPNLYVLDLRTLLLKNKVMLPESPEFVVWK